MNHDPILSLAQTLLRWGRVESAKAILRGYVAMDRDDDRAWSLLRDAESDPARAIVFAKQVVRCVPNDPLAALELGRLAFETGDLAVARSMVARYTRHDDAQVRLRALTLARAFS